MLDRGHVDTVRLLLDIAPTVFRSERFAIKGGTAINLSVQDLPRLSVDIDVVFLDHMPDRQNALAVIGDELRTIGAALKTRGFHISPSAARGEEVCLLVRSPVAQVKVEVNFVFRGTLMTVQRRDLAPAARELQSHIGRSLKKLTRSHAPLDRARPWSVGQQFLASLPVHPFPLLKT